MALGPPDWEPWTPQAVRTRPEANVWEDETTGRLMIETAEGVKRRKEAAASILAGRPRYERRIYPLF